MKSNTVIRSEAMKLLVENLGLVETGIFIHDIKSEKFDYTEWRQDLWDNLTLEEIYDNAVEFQKEKNKKEKS